MKQKVLQLVVDRIVVEESRVVIQHVVPTGAVRLQTEQLGQKTPGTARELAGVLPQRHRLVVAVGDDHVAQHVDSAPLGLARDLGIDAVEPVLVERLERRHTFLGAEAHRGLRAGEGPEQGRVRLL